MASINDWAAKAAERIMFEASDKVGSSIRGLSKERIAAIIATFAKPLVELVERSRREHHLHCGKGRLELIFNGKTVYLKDDWDGACTCGADAWNETVDKVLAGEK